MRDTTSRRSSAGGFGPREGDLSSLPPLIREKIMKDKPAEVSSDSDQVQVVAFSAVQSKIALHIISLA